MVQIWCRYGIPIIQSPLVSMAHPRKFEGMAGMVATFVVDLPRNVPWSKHGTIMGTKMAMATGYRWTVGTHKIRTCHVCHCCTPTIW